MLNRSLSAKLDTVCRRQRVRALLHGACGALLAALGAFTLLRVVAYAVSVPPWLIVAVTLLSALAAWIGLSGGGGQSRAEAAALIDRSLHLQERVLAAVEFSSTSHHSNPLVHKLQADAGRFADHIDPRQLVPYGLPRYAWVLPPLIALALLVHFWLPYGPSPHAPPAGFSVAELAPDEEQSIQQIAETLRTLGVERDLPEYVELGTLLQQLLERVRRGEISTDRFYAELARIEDRLNATPEPPTSLAHQDTEMTGAQGDPPDATDVGQTDSGSLRRPTPPGDGEGESGDRPWNETTEDRPGDDPGEDDAQTAPEGGSASTEGEADSESTDTTEDGAESGSQVPGPGPSSSNRSDEAEIEGTDAGSDAPDASEGASERLSETENERLQLQGVLDATQATVRALDSLGAPAGGESVDGFALSEAVEFSAGAEHSVERESVPPVLRHWVQLYFETIASDE